MSHICMTFCFLFHRFQCVFQLSSLKKRVSDCKNERIFAASFNINLPKFFGLKRALMNKETLVFLTWNLR